MKIPKISKNLYLTEKVKLLRLFLIFFLNHCNLLSNLNEVIPKNFIAVIEKIESPNDRIYKN